MKKLLLTTLALFSLSLAFAQEWEPTIERGDVIISGSVNYQLIKQNDEETESLNIAVKPGFFASQKVALGVVFGYSNSNENFDSFSSRYGVFTRYYITPEKRYSVFTEAGVAYQELTIKLGYADFEYTGYDANVGVGINYFLTRRIAMNAYWGAFDYVKLEQSDIPVEETIETFNLNLGFDSFNLGLLLRL